jgi:shikimate dehydrogenase
MSLRAAVLGHPISHSKSPALHLSAYGQLGAGISYTAIDVTEELLPSFMRQIRHQPGWRGLSVTMP